MSDYPDTARLREVHADIGTAIERLDVALATQNLIYARIVDIDNFQRVLKRIRKPLGAHLKAVDRFNAAQPDPEPSPIILPPILKE